MRSERLDTPCEQRCLRGEDKNEMKEFGVRRAESVRAHPENDLEVLKRPSDLLWTFTFLWNDGVSKSRGCGFISLKTDTREFTLAFRKGMNQKHAGTE